MIAKTERFEMRLDQATIGDIDEWRSAQSDLPSRAEAIRRLVQESLARSSTKQLTLTDGERLITSMLCDLHKEMKIEDGVDATFVENAIFGGHYWAMDWQYPGIFHGHEDDPQVVSEVVDILDMWSLIENGFSKLSKKSKDEVKKEARPLGEHVQFSGFDGNNESEHIGVARCLINDLERFTEFKGRGLNSHFPPIEAHRRMLKVFKPIRAGLVGQGLNSSQIISILKEQIHPDNR